jgi:hypothetical protein
MRRSTWFWGVIDHYVLGIHHVVERAGLSVFDHAFVGFGLLLIAIGCGCVHSGRFDRRPNAAHTGRAVGSSTPAARS